MDKSSVELIRIVFVLDVSGSMSAMKCKTLQLSVTRMIEEIPDNSYVGIVSLIHYTKRLHRVVQITDKSVRDGLINSLPAMTRGMTGKRNVGAGILEGLAAFHDEGIVTEGATMFVITDGEVTTGTDYISDVLPTLIEAKITIVSIAIGNPLDSKLESLSEATNGSKTLWQKFCEFIRKLQKII